MKRIIIMLIVVVVAFMCVSCSYTDNKAPAKNTMQVSSPNRFFTYDLDDWNWKVEQNCLLLTNKYSGEIVCHTLTGDGVIWFKISPKGE